MGRHGKEKGNEFERTVCCQLSLWMSSGVRDDLLWRAAMSGGRATLIKRKSTADECNGKDMGDIVAVHEDGRLLVSLFVLECKFWFDLGWHGLVYGTGGDFLREYLKTKLTANKARKQPLYIVKQNQKQAMVGTTVEGLRILRVAADRPAMPVRVSFPQYNLHFVRMTDMVLSDFRKVREAYRGMDPAIGGHTLHGQPGR